MEQYYLCNWLSFEDLKNEKNKKLKCVNKNYIYCSSGIVFQSNWSVYCIPILWICRQPNYHQLRIRSEVFFSLEILNAYNVWQYHFRL